MVPDWRNEEIIVFKIVLMKYGIGNWKRIKSMGLFPNKTNSQFILATQRLIGQQSMAGSYIKRI